MVETIIEEFVFGTCGGIFTENDIREFIDESEFIDETQLTDDEINRIIDEVEFIAEFGF